MFERKETALFGDKLKYVGISCGCHANEGEFCCFAYAEDVKEKGDETMDVMQVERANCEDSGSWSDKLKGKDYSEVE
jgi:hypothetical protein